MINKNIYKIFRKGFREKGIKFLLYGSIHYAICEISFYVDYFKFAYITISKTNHKITVNDSIMYINFGDKGISRELYIHKKRENFSTKFMEEFVDKNETVIDIGANIGYYTLLTSRLAKEGKIYSVEPISSNIDILKKNVQLNNRKNIHIYQYAIGDKDGKSKMFIYDRCNWCSFTKNPEGNIVDEIDVQVLTLDNFVAENLTTLPTFVRMDVEGYEYQIIKGARKILESEGLKLFIELHPHLMTKENFTELLNILIDNKFKIRAIFLETGAHNYQQINFLNKLRKAMGLPEIGFIGNDFGDIYELSKYSYACCVFFEK